MRILALMKYGSRAASTRQRLIQYIPYLNERDIVVDLSPLLDDQHIMRITQGRGAAFFSTLNSYIARTFLLLRSHRYDLIWVHYEQFPYLPGVFERIVRLAGRPVIVDFDDAIFHGYDQHPRGIVRWFLGDKLAPLLRYASVCLCGNAYLQAYAERYCLNSVIVPTVVDTTIYKPANLAGETRAPVVGWIGSPSTWRYVEPVLPILLPLIKSRGGVFRVIGAGPRALGIDGVEAADWREDREVADVQSMDIGIMPLPDEPWARGKCGYKLIQYMACGLPVIASPVGVNTQIVSHGENGFLASTTHEWTEALDALLGDAALRRRMGVQGRRIVQESYSLSSQQDRVLHLLQSTFDGRRPSSLPQSAGAYSANATAGQRP